MSIDQAISILNRTIQWVQNYDFASQAQQQPQSQRIEEQKYDSTLKWPADKVRDTFINYFSQKCQHQFMKSSPVVPVDDPTLLFTNAGMNQFKPIFLGQLTDDDPLSKLRRACNSQKCIRAGGKHNDLDDVGKDTYHHTFFEMLGNWSFGDYFKKEAIEMAWDLLVNVYGLQPSRMYATYFGGNASTGLEPDEEARQLWLQYLPESRVLPFDMKDNFWEMGETGPCGPCTEIHYDRLDTGRDASALVNMDDASVIEIWNLVFIQFNRNDDGSLQLLPNKHVDTGMGFERITSILQDVDSNYDTDVFLPILDEIQRKTKCATPYQGKVGGDDVTGFDMAYRVVADHIRTLTFAVTDGAAPGNQGRDHVVRRICRRGVRFGKKLGGEIGFFKDLVDVVITQMSGFFPELAKKQEIVKSIIEKEERLFSRTLNNGEKRFKFEVDRLRQQGKAEIDGRVACTLYTTFGFPIDLTVLMAEEQGMTVNLDAYHAEMQKEQEKSAKRGNDRVEFATLGDNERVYLQNHNVQETDDSFKYNWRDIECNVVAIFDSNRRTFVTSASADDNALIGVVLDRTAFYAESGGQVGDIGYIENGQDDAFKVEAVQEFGGYAIHIGQVTNGQIACQQRYTAKVDFEYRGDIAPNHTMTHVLNFALRKVLGTECHQKGSLVDAERLRFDYSTSEPLNLAQIQAVSHECNRIIASSLNVFTDVIEYDRAAQINALRAMFGERYPKFVRVVTIGIEPKIALSKPDSTENFKYSIELCGGTHLRNTSEARQFVFLTDDALSAGIRRIVALTGKGAQRATQDANDLLDEFKTAEQLKDNDLSLQLPSLSFKVDQAKIDAVLKLKLREQLKTLKDRDRVYQKQLSVQRKEKVLRVIKGLQVESSQQCVALRIDVGLDKKAMKEGIKQFFKHNPHKNMAIMLMSCSPNDKNKIIILAEKHPKGSCGMHCGQWLLSLLPFIDGPKEWKGDKNEKKAEVQGLDMSKISQVLESANQFNTK
eukprot:CAMPEP_0202693630 /NCGR_PEP_ID=MMETSP1385-20130828/7679_1 /ASSEMBLY_ACC=CAM_ASM_000861 /TAXON_ID=933848 /ORGANISM="Elphidium margaritaceum" /LENGTH=995 /DNA_ID=CAMNT_0049349327 /DNA_START=88 /DNA_END=3075 /DNA_ORIENTATION=+